MDVSTLVFKLADVWEALCAKNIVERQQVHRKITAMKADPKADPNALVASEELRENLSGTLFAGKKF